MSLKRAVVSCKQYLRGAVLDVGAGPADRYGHLVDGVLTRMDIRPGDDIALVGTVEAIPVPDSSFDAILCTQVIEHVRQPWRAPKEFFRILKAGGHAVITVPQLNELHEEPHDYFRYTNHGISSLFVDAGFVVVNIVRRGGVWSSLAQIMIRYLTDCFGMYNRAILGRVFGRLATLAARVSLWLDARDTSRAGCKHALGWCIVVMKP